ncbi:DUF881 domain-containing protein [Bacillus mangrovi]|uniref:DUF881 domain-containing protein n=1 Tax=Metabacillus mangrovi TaxID=1491830 RepID=A0A7X2S3D5_9BACI|nr:DUF881 domain-containing protein [Metabacillus mangrovi]
MPERKKIIGYTLIMGLFGFMLSVQFQSIKEPAERDSRDLWEIREQLSEEQKQQSELLKEIRKYNQLLSTYDSNETNARDEALKKTLDQLKLQAGLTEVKGEGIVLVLEPLFSGELIGEKDISVSPDLLRRLINELNANEAEHISIDGHRVSSTTVIRNINGTVKMDGFPLDSLPIKINVISEDSAKLYDRIKASSTHDLFAVDNIKMTVRKPESSIVIPGSDKSIRSGDLHPYEIRKGGDS